MSGGDNVTSCNMHMDNSIDMGSTNDWMSLDFGKMIAAHLNSASLVDAAPVVAPVLWVPPVELIMRVLILAAATMEIQKTT